MKNTSQVSNATINSIAAKAAAIYSSSNEDHPCEDATEFQEELFCAVGAAREALGDLLTDEAAFKAAVESSVCAEMANADEIVRDYFAQLHSEE